MDSQEIKIDSIFDDIPEKVKDLYMDLGWGICNAQKLWDAEKGTYDMSKVKKYKQKTNLNQIINDALQDSNYRKSYEWEHDSQFVFFGELVELIRYDIQTGDVCMVKINGTDKTITKKYFREIWELRDE